MLKVSKLKFVLLALLLSLGTSLLRAQILFDNGPFFNRIGTGAGGANESVLYTTTFGMGTIGFGHQATSFNRVADDFAIPDCKWRIDSIVFFGYQTGSTLTSTFTGVNFRIWDSIPDAIGSNIVFGDTTTNRMTRTVWSGAYRITETTTGASTRPIMRNVCALSNVVLNTGSFWIDWSSTGSLASGPWAPPRTPLNIALTGNGKQRIGSTWNNAVDGGTGTPAQGFPFIVYGTILDPIADAGVDQSVCPGNSAILGGTPPGTGGSGPYTYAWSNAGTLDNPAIGNPIATPTSTTTYVLSLTDNSGCVAVDTTVVTVGSVGSNFLVADTTICLNATITLDAGAGTSFLWSNGDTAQTTTVGAGTYSVEVDNGSGCLAVDTVVVTSSQQVVIFGNGTFCQQAGDTLTASVAPASYQWNTGATTQTIIVNSGGVFSVTATEANSCSSSDTFAIVMLVAPTAAFNFTIGAAGLSYTFTDQSTGGPSTYFWDFGDGGTSTLASPAHTYANSGSFTATLIVTNSCGSDTSTQSLTVTDVAGSLAVAQISIAPNPAGQRFAFHVDGFASGALKVEMMDLQGHVCNTWLFQDVAAGVEQKVDALKLAKGVYFLRFSSEEFTEIRKVMLQ